MAVVYWIAQFLGAIIAAYVLKALYPANIVAIVRGSVVSDLGGHQPDPGHRARGDRDLLPRLRGLRHRGRPKRGPKVGGFAIGLTVTADILAIGPLTGGSMNPARSFGPAVVTHIFEGQTAYWVGPLLGGIVAALLYDRLFMRDETPPRLAALSGAARVGTRIFRMADVPAPLAVARARAEDQRALAALRQ